MEDSEIFYSMALASRMTFHLAQQQCQMVKRRFCTRRESTGTLTEHFYYTAFVLPSGDKHGPYVMKAAHSEQQSTYQSEWRDGKKEGVAIKWYDNGMINNMVVFRDGLKEGIFEEWFNDGVIHLHWPYVHGKREGLSEEWWRINGRIRHRYR